MTLCCPIISNANNPGLFAVTKNNKNLLINDQNFVLIFISVIRSNIFNQIYLEQCAGFDPADFEITKYYIATGLVSCIVRHDFVQAGLLWCLHHIERHDR